MEFTIEGPFSFLTGPDYPWVQGLSHPPPEGQRSPSHAPTLPDSPSRPLSVPDSAESRLKARYQAARMHQSIQSGRRFPSPAPHELTAESRQLIRSAWSSLGCFQCEGLEAPSLPCLDRGYKSPQCFPTEALCRSMMPHPDTLKALSDFLDSLDRDRACREHLGSSLRVQ